MFNKVKKQNLLKTIIFTFLFVNLFATFVFATSHERANIIIGKNSSEGENIYIEKNNATLDSIISIMSEEDALTAYVYISEYRKGDTSMEKLLIDLIHKYDPNFALNIAQYILVENDTLYLTTYNVRRPSYTIECKPISTIALFEKNELDEAAQIFWNKFKSIVPVDFYENVENIHFEKNKNQDNLITICVSSISADRWELSVDISLLDSENESMLYDNIMYATVYYYILKKDQIEQLVKTKGNYQYAGETYRTDSYINKFYKKFWKGRRSETNSDQYALYKKEFLNRKASRTVYDDMAVSFVNYVKNGYMRRYLGFRADKTNFFDDYEFFKNLAKSFRTFLGIKKLS